MAGLALSPAGHRSALRRRPGRWTRPAHPRTGDDVRAGSAPARRAGGGDRRLRGRPGARLPRAAGGEPGGAAPHAGRRADQLCPRRLRRARVGRDALGRFAAVWRHHGRHRPHRCPAAAAPHPAGAPRRLVSQVGGDRQRSHRRAARGDRPCRAHRRRPAAPLAGAGTRLRARRLRATRRRRGLADPLARPARQPARSAEDTRASRRDARRLHARQPRHGRGAAWRPRRSSASRWPISRSPASGRSRASRNRSSS